MYVDLIQIYQKEKREKLGNLETKQQSLDTGEHGTEKFVRTASLQRFAVPLWMLSGGEMAVYPWTFELGLNFRILFLFIHLMLSFHLCLGLQILFRFQAISYV